MQSLRVMFFSFAPLLLASAVSAKTLSTPNPNKAVTEVVHLLQDMLDESKKEGDTERVLYAKYKCYCDTQEAEKKAELDTAKTNIALLEAKIEELLAHSAETSKAMAENEADIDEVTKVLADALSVRNQEASAYAAYKSDTNIAIGACNDSIIELATIGADQTMAVGADHKQYMSDFSLGQLKSTVKQALVAASAGLNKQQEQKLASFLQAPFTGTYTSQAGEVFGIIKDMRATFMANLADATAAENKAIGAYLAFKGVNEGKKSHMVNHIRPTLQGDMSGYQSDLSDRRSQLTVQKGIVTNTEAFIDELTTNCDTKQKEYQHRTLLRTNEQMAVSKAIAILNSDAAFEIFDKVDAANTGATGFLQLHSVQHVADLDKVKREKAESYLRGAAGKTHSRLLSKIVAMLEVENPFDTVLAEITKMIDIIDEEGDADDEHLTWCNDERTVTDADVLKKNQDIQTLNGQIGQLDTQINDPVTGLKKQIADTEEKIRINDESQKQETADRKEAEAIYVKNIKTCQDAKVLLEKAIEVLEEYYKDLANKQFSLLQQRNHQNPLANLPTSSQGTAAASYTAPTMPATWGTSDAGQGSDGNDAVSMLKYILKETGDEEDAYHQAELQEQHAYEDSMKTLTDTEETEKGNLVTFTEQLAEKEKELLAKEKDLAQTEKEKQALLSYLAEIKPGCDFITANIDLRKSNRDEEKTALQTASNLIKGSPAYTTAVAQAHNESLGECLEFCAGDWEDTAKCKACLAGVTIPAYCAGHPQTTGC